MRFCRVVGRMFSNHLNRMILNFFSKNILRRLKADFRIFLLMMRHWNWFPKLVMVICVIRSICSKQRVFCNRKGKFLAKLFWNRETKISIMIKMARNITTWFLRCTKACGILMVMRRFIGLGECSRVVKIHDILSAEWWILHPRMYLIHKRLF